ncbi:MAG TPA: hypothetical protein VI168_00155 [Croceibacterium sp.]
MGSAANGRGLGAAGHAALAFALLAGAPLAARETVEASPPTALGVTIYRDPDRGAGGEMDFGWPQGFAMITETRTVALPPGESTIRFAGVAEGMIAVSAIVTGLPGGTIEKNRNAELLSPGSLVDGTLGNRVTVTRTNPATGEAVAQEAIVRTRADGGLVLQTSDGFEAVRCAGLPERLTFDRVPAGLSPQPVFTLDTRDPAGGTYTLELTYLAWGFDWQAHYVATVDEPGRSDAVRMRLMSWLTLLNDNAQSFEDAELLVVAGKLNVVSDFEELARSPNARAINLTCYPFGSTAAGMPVQPAPRPGAAAQRRARGEDAAEGYDESDNIIVTGTHIMASEEQLGDLKLYRVPERVTVASESLKQVAFLVKDEVEGRLLYETACTPESDDQDDAEPVRRLMATVNDERHGLGVALPMGGITVFEPSPRGDQLVAEDRLRDYAAGQDVEIGLGESSQVWARCITPSQDDWDDETRWLQVRTVLTNANARPVTVRVVLGQPSERQFRRVRGTRIKDGKTIVEVVVPANGRREVAWESREVEETE